MMLFITGGSGSGKSAYAEQTVFFLSEKKDIKKYYLATMQATDRESLEKVNRHRRLRSGKHFITIEQPTDIQNSLYKMQRGEKVVLLECISNLTANEMFSGENPKSEAWVVEKVIREVEALKNEATHLVAVSSNVFEDGTEYDAGAMQYIRAMGKIHRRLAAMADQVTELAVGIPIHIKQPKGGKL